MKREPIYKTEADLCAAFIVWAKPKGWTSYAETEGWDILLVAADGTQIGIQAKLKFNLSVICQAIEGTGWGSDIGPDFRAILVPETGSSDICAALGITVIYAAGYLNATKPTTPDFRPNLPGDRYNYPNYWHYTNHAKRHKLPAYVPDVIAGSPAPVQLTNWKIAALKVVAVLNIRGYVTREDFRRYGIDHRRWVNDNTWLVPDRELPGQYLRGPGLNFDVQHQDVFKQVRADVEKELDKAGRLILA